MRYYIANEDRIPYKAQPDEGYTKLQVISAVHRYANQDANILGGHYTDYIGCYTILDSNFREASELYTAL